MIPTSFIGKKKEISRITSSLGVREETLRQVEKFPGATGEREVGVTFGERGSFGLGK